VNDLSLDYWNAHAVVLIFTALVIKMRLFVGIEHNKGDGFVAVDATTMPISSGGRKVILVNLRGTREGRRLHVKEGVATTTARRIEILGTSVRQQSAPETLHDGRIQHGLALDLGGIAKRVSVLLGTDVMNTIKENLSSVRVDVEVGIVQAEFL